MSHFHVFGYGSLVNRETHAYGDHTPASLDGWKRVWRHTSKRHAAFLNVTPDDGTQIDGLILSVDHGHDDLAQREQAYERVEVSERIRHDLPARPEIGVFTITENEQNPPSADHAILMSYLDVVVSGYYDIFGEEGVARFFETTEGWELPILNDRSDPVYPRATKASARHSDLTDWWVQSLGLFVSTKG